MNQSQAQQTPDQAWNILGVKKHTLAAWRSYGRYQLPFVKAGRLLCYRSSDVDYSSKGRALLQPAYRRFRYEPPFQH
jgi:predicted site-specific integrase-resolvase